MPVAPESLAHALLHNSANLEALMEQLAASAEEIADALYSKPFAELDQLRINLAVAQARARAAQALPAAIDTLAQLTRSEKPEVARHCAMAVAQLNGMFQKHPPQPVHPPHTHHLPDLSSQEKKLVQELGQLAFWERDQLMTICKLPPDQLGELTELSEFNTQLKNSKGISLTRLTRFQFKGFAQHLDTFFHELGLRFEGAYTPKVPFENSFSNPKALERARKLLAQNSDPAGTPISRLASEENNAPSAAELTPHNITQTPVFPAPNPPFDTPPAARPPA
ncbi:MAG TPA: hypothetical protein VHM90_10215 [Phycisphaerae bacterium]|nr:hypothetical protein [Phycisphaerae bacterium]